MLPAPLNLITAFLGIFDWIFSFAFSSSSGHDKIISIAGTASNIILWYLSLLPSSPFPSSRLTLRRELAVIPRLLCSLFIITPLSLNFLKLLLALPFYFFASLLAPLYLLPSFVTFLTKESDPSPNGKFRISPNPNPLPLLHLDLERDQQKQKQGEGELEEETPAAAHPSPDQQRRDLGTGTEGLRRGRRQVLFKRNEIKKILEELRELVHEDEDDDNDKEQDQPDA
jgi:hypothetical protein